LLLLYNVLQSLTGHTYDNLDSAKAAKEQLHGCDIYSGCCTLRTEYAKVSVIVIICFLEDVGDNEKGLSL